MIVFLEVFCALKDQSNADQVFEKSTLWCGPRKDSIFFLLVRKTEKVRFDMFSSLNGNPPYPLENFSSDE